MNAKAPQPAPDGRRKPDQVPPPPPPKKLGTSGVHYVYHSSEGELQATQLQWNRQAEQWKKQGYTWAAWATSSTPNPGYLTTDNGFIWCEWWVSDHGNEKFVPVRVEDMPKAEGVE